MDAGEGEPIPRLAVAEGPYPVALHADFIEPGIVVQGEGDVVFRKEMLVIHLFQINAMKEVAVHHQHWIVIHPIQGFAERPAGTEDLRFKLDEHLWPGSQRRLDLYGLMMAIDHNWPTVADVQLLEQPVQKQLIEHWKQRLRPESGIGTQTGTVPGGEKDGLHGSAYGIDLDLNRKLLYKSASSVE